ncbi:uncharacterized protein EV420DRAFT_1306669 [Desarmillaria tabescens]|uniref:Attractin/MKLN-like beta-propeller domain-containing protein n=1 Tax=Armillaria tabescens TaxID=1929756 RepID=A0AA39N7Y8_ARMTA|nr:uncharacterized protein EV420DRAFT_1306669 [Desarmillaria tabescens]KAK0460700.1 hypothetical protein EV420DRAFT_1306669 [Desarmillaria tabescens]
MTPTPNEPERRPVRNARPSYREPESSSTETDTKVHDRKIVKKKGKAREVKRKSSNGDQAELARYEAGPEGYKKIRNTGSLPHFNDWCTIVVDDIGKKIYMYGGSRPNDRSCIPTNDFHVLDIDTMQWKKLAPKFWSNAHQPFEPVGKSKPLPSLFKPACTFLHFQETTYIFMFGGFDVDEEAVSSRLIAIDLDDSQWWYVEVEGGDVCGRMNASMIGINNKLFIFGGRASYDKESLGMASYSIAEYTNHRWNWMSGRRDRAYDAHVPPLGFGGRALSVHGGRKILLTPGRLANKTPVNMQESNSIFFHTTNFTFRAAADTVGTFPGNLRWYWSYSSEGSQPFVQPLPTTSPLPRKRKRLSSPPREVVVSPPHVIIAGWVDYGKEDHIMPELWQYFLPPEEKIQCFNIRSTIWSMDLNLHSFAVVGNRMILLGFEAESEGDKVPDDATYNICVEVDMGVISKNATEVKIEEE